MNEWYEELTKDAFIQGRCSDSKCGEVQKTWQTNKGGLYVNRTINYKNGKGQKLHRIILLLVGLVTLYLQFQKESQFLCFLDQWS